MRTILLPVLLLLAGASAAAYSQSSERPISLDGITLTLAPADFMAQNTPPPGYAGSYKPLAPQTQQAPCGGFSTSPCTGATIANLGPSAEKLYEAAKLADARGDRQQSIDYLTRSAEMGYRKAQYALGTDYRNGNGVPKDLKKATYWLDLAAQQGSTTSQAALAEINPAQAIHYLQTGADKRDPQSEFDLGLDYELGQGVSHNRAKAIQYLRRASIDGGHPDGEQLAGILVRSSAAKRFASRNALLAAVPAAPANPKYQARTGCPAWYDSHHNGSAQDVIGFSRVFCLAHPNCTFTYNNEGPIACKGENTPLFLKP